MLGVTELNEVALFPHLPIDGYERYFLVQYSREKNAWLVDLSL